MDPRDASRNSKDGLTSEALPSLPAKVDSKHIKSNGLLLSDDEIKRIRDSEPVAGAGNGFTRVSKKELESEFSVIRNGEELYAIYKGKEQGLGAGKMGAVKLAQNLQTGEWVALKVQKIAGDNLQDLQGEYQRLQQAGYALGESKPIASKKKKSDQGTALETYQILMGYIPGVTMDSIITKNIQMSPEQRLQLGQNALAAFHDINVNGVVHGDIHGGNVLINLNTLQATPIDFGLSSNLAEKSPDDAKRAMRNEMTKLANMMVNLYGFAIAKKDGVFVAVENEKGNGSKWIPDAETRKKLAGVISELYKENPNVDKAINEMAKLKVNYSYLPQQAAKVAIIDVNEFNPNDKTFMEALKNFDQVVLVDNHQKKDVKFYSQIRSAIEGQGVAVHDQLLRGDSFFAAANKIPEHLGQGQAAYFVVSQSRASIELTNPAVACVNPAQDFQSQLTEHANKLPVSQADKGKIEEILLQEAARLEGGRGDKNVIGDLKKFVNEMKSDPAMNYNALAEKLQTLEKDVGKTGLMKGIFKVLDKKTPTQMVVGQIKDSVGIKVEESLAKKRGPLPAAKVPKPHKVQAGAPPVAADRIENSNIGAQVTVETSNRITFKK